MALIWLSICLFTFLGITSLAVDFGRWEMCKTQVQRAADAGARAGALTLASNYNYAPTEASVVTGANYVDTGKISKNSTVTVSVQMLNWNSSTNYTVLSSGNYSQANAVRVTVSYTVPLTFGGVIGLSSKPVSRSATAVLSVRSQSVYVNANGNLWLAGEPAGTQASSPSASWQGQNVNPYHPWEYDIAGPVGGTAADGEPYESPVEASIPLVQGALMTVSNVSGGGAQGPTSEFSKSNADGQLNGVTNYCGDNWTANGASEHGIADVWMPTCALSAVFLGNALPDNSAAPAALNFSTTASRDYSTLSPLVKQPFFVGNGQTSGGTQQMFVVPNGATRLFLGMMDNEEWSNNTGGYSATINQYSVQMVQ